MKQEDFSKDDYVLLAKLAQQTERYDEMMGYANKLLMCEVELNAAERNLCSSAFKNAVGTRRAEIKVLLGLQEKLKKEDRMSEAIIKYVGEIEAEISKCCLSLIKLIDEVIFVTRHQIKSVEAKVFYMKLKADQYRYLCEYPHAQRHEEHTEAKNYFEHAESNYEEADALARSNLPQTSPVRLALHLNMSVFLYEHRGQRERALELANRAFEEAYANIDTVNEANYKECTMILQLIRDNINLWNEE